MRGSLNQSPQVKTIRAFRKEHKWSQEQLSDFLGISPASIRNWEQGRTSIPTLFLTTLKFITMYEMAVGKRVKIGGSDGQACD